jgi:type VI secretion system protein ImpL
MKLLKNWWFVTLTCAILVALLLALGLPLVVSFLRPMWVRVSCVLLVAAIWGALAFHRRWKARKAAAALAAELAGSDASGEEGAALAARMREALAKLKQSAQRRDYLYAKPWYVIIGPPGAGKTTALLNSGLRFPFSDSAVKGIGGTRNLDFWFADEAVMVDTAGRYTTQDSNYEVDSRGWTTFLDLLRRNRPLQPANGVIVAIGVDELIASDCAAIDAHARAVRRRLAELRRTLEVSAPVYTLLTKADLLAGFVEYFEDLDIDGRRAVLGSTLDYKAGRPGAETLARAFDAMGQAVADRQAKRLHDEGDGARRALLLGFPSQLQSLRARLMRFLEGAFASGDEPTGQLRGFYLTSGVQQGAPLDRILAGMAEVYDRPVQAMPGAGTSGRAYFLNRLLTEVMFPEAGLVTADPKARARRRSQLVGAFAAVAAVAVLTLGLWSVSYARNRGFQSDLLAKTDAAVAQLRESGADLKQVRDGDADLRETLPALDALRALPQGYADRQAGGPPLTMRFGLFQSGLSAQAEGDYREALRRVMLPRLLLRLEAVLRSDGGDAMKVYEPLKIYLMLGQQGPMNARAVKNWVTADWAANVYPGGDSQPERDRLARHLDALLADADMASVWPDRRAPLDGALVASARQAIGTLSLGDRAYAVMKQKAMGAGADWRVADVLSAGDAAAFVGPDQVLGTRVPYFFTRAGFEKAYTLGLATVSQDLKRDLWVLGQDAATGGVQGEMSDMRVAVAGRYARDYIAAWDGVVATLKPAGYFQDPVALAAIGKSPSPLKRVLLELRKNTIFAGGVGAGVARAVSNRLSSVRGAGLIDAAQAGRASGLDAASEITGYFRPLHDYVGDGKAPGPIDDFVAALKQAGQAVAAAKMASGGGGSDAMQAAMAQATAAMAGAAGGAPPQLQGFVSAAAGGGATAQVDAAKGAVADAWVRSVLPACQEVAQERYPFFGAATQDAAAVDLMRVFGMGGTIDGFVQQRLKPLMDTSGPVWRWRADDPLAAGFDPASAEQFAKAAQIRDLLAGGLPLKVALTRLGAGVGAVIVSAGGATYRLDQAGGPARPIVWTAGAGLPEASVVLLKTGASANPTPADEVKRIEAEGLWALFKLMDLATRENDGPTAIKATFGDGAATATLTLTLPSEHNPFGRAGQWSFRCPSAL